MRPRIALKNAAGHARSATIALSYKKLHNTQMSFDDTQDKTILAIETSCDETAIAIVECSGGIKTPHFRILSNVVASQAKLHAKFGGVVPNLAKREHEKNLPLVLQQALSNIQCFPSTLNVGQAPPIDAIAVTVGPGLAPALWVGVNFAKELATQWKKPLIAVNHMMGHIASVLLSQTATNETNNKLLRRISIYRDVDISKKKITFPALALLVSGGHTELVLMKSWRNKKIIGETLDDAAGEAFDKVARMLELGYPGGPAISAEVVREIKNQKYKTKTTNKKLEIVLPRPMIHIKDYNFSFSGLKTAVLYLVKKLKEDDVSIKKARPFIAKEFQEAVVDVLVAKTMRAAKEYKVKTIILGGGVAANQQLRERLGKTIEKDLHDTCYLLPATQFTGDNAAMIAAGAYLMGKKTSWTKLKAIDRLKI